MDIRNYNISLPPEYRAAIEIYAIKSGCVPLKTATFDLIEQALQLHFIEIDREKKSTPTESFQRTRGFRLQKDSVMPETMREIAESLGFGKYIAELEWKKMCEWSAEQTNKRGAKRDWHATFRNWLKNARRNKEYRNFYFPAVYEGGAI